MYTQAEQCQQLCNKVAKDYPALAADAMFVKAVQLAKEGKAKEAVKLLTPYAVGEKELQMKLVCVQLLLSQDEREEAINILENLNERDRSLPGIVSALVTLHMANNNREKASAALKNAVNYYKKNKVSTFVSHCFFIFFNFTILCLIITIRKLPLIWESCGDKPPISTCAQVKLKWQLIFCKKWWMHHPLIPKHWHN